MVIKERGWQKVPRRVGKVRCEGVSFTNNASILVPFRHTEEILSCKKKDRTKSQMQKKLKENPPSEETK